MKNLKKATFRFYEELNDFLPNSKRKIRFENEFIGRTSIKDLIESIGVPHTEIDLILVNGKSIGFDYLVKDNDYISVYPVFESLDISALQHLRPKPLRENKFVLDVHLGTLARYLRMLGFDSVYKNDFADKEIVKISLKENRTILTKDKGILKRSEVTHGHFIHNKDPKKQILEVVNRFDLKNQIIEFSRCLNCNSKIEKIEKEKVIDQIPPKVKEWQNEFWICSNCNKIYWKGTHYENMMILIHKINEE